MWFQIIYFLHGILTFGLEISVYQREKCIQEIWKPKYVFENVMGYRI